MRAFSFRMAWLVLVAAGVPACHDGGDDDGIPVPPPGAFAPPAPANLRAILGDAQVRLAWDAFLGAVSYTVKRGAASRGPFATVATSVPETSFVDLGLQNGTPYFYGVSAVNASGESPLSTEATATPQSGASPPPVSFRKDSGNPVLGAASSPSVLKLGPDSWVMYFGSGDSGNAPVGRAISTDGFATSPDGITWTRPAEPALSVGAAGSWDSGKVWGASVVRDGAELKMWYSGRGAGGIDSVGYATSP